ncbi:hypothetical protein ACFQE0_05490 [Methylobacterium komagatae]|uniref:Uncharacterized protein n=1 Tax=Methylobacterium komagatae TaxID=374425 RepID=A0ABW2BGJ3_9HYPH
MASTETGTIYAGALRNTRALEMQASERMERQLSGLERYPDYAVVLRRHVDTRKGPLAQLDQALDSIGKSSSTLEEAVTKTYLDLTLSGAKADG